MLMLDRFSKKKALRGIAFRSIRILLETLPSVSFRDFSVDSVELGATVFVSTVVVSAVCSDVSVECSLEIPFPWAVSSELGKYTFPFSPFSASDRPDFKLLLERCSLWCGWCDAVSILFRTPLLPGSDEDWPPFVDCNDETARKNAMTRRNVGRPRLPLTRSRGFADWEPVAETDLVSRDIPAMLFVHVCIHPTKISSKSRSTKKIKIQNIIIPLPLMYFIRARTYMYLQASMDSNSWKIEHSITY